MRQLFVKSFYMVAVLLVLAETKSYQGAQVLRIHNYKDISVFEAKFGGSIWMEDEHFIDLSFEIAKLQDVKKFLTTEGIKFEILISDIQNLINNENSVSSFRNRAAGMSWDQYHDLDTIYNFLDQMKTKYPNLVELVNIGKSVENRNLIVLRITTNELKNEKIWIDSGIHAREWIAPATCTYLINYILSNWKTLNKNMKNKTWYFMPVVNPDGYEYSRTTDRLWRKNRRQFQECDGVDLNRNFNVNWNSNQQSQNPCFETYSGPSAASEPETQAIQKFLTNHDRNLKAYITIHSYGQYIMYPWSSKSERAPNYLLMNKVGRAAAANIKRTTGTNYVVNQEYPLVGPVSGGVDNWVKQTLKVPITLALELRDTGTFGFLLPAGQIIGTSKEVLEVARAVAFA